MRGLLYPHNNPIPHPEGSFSVGRSKQLPQQAVTAPRLTNSREYCASVSADLLPEHSSKLPSQRHKAGRMAKEYGGDLTMLSADRQEAIVEPNACLATSPEGPGDDIGLNLNPHLPPWPTAAALAFVTTKLPNLPGSPIASPTILLAHRRSASPLSLAVDAAADGHEVPNVLDSPSDDRPSFDTLVKDLVQSRPDSPIGGHQIPPTLPVKPMRSFNVGTLVIKGKLPPRIEISCSDTDSGFAGSMNTPPMFTAPESPGNARTDGSDDRNYMDLSQLPTTEVRDFGLAADGSRSKKASKVPEPIKPAAENKPKSSRPENDPEYCEDCVSPLTKPLKTDGHMDDAGKGTATGNASANVKKENDKNAKTRKVPITKKAKVNEKQDKAAGKAGKIQTIGKKGEVGTKFPVPAGVLKDATGELSPPGMPKPKKLSVMKAKGQTAIRKCRGVVIRTPVANLLVGRFVVFIFLYSIFFKSFP